MAVKMRLIGGESGVKMVPENGGIGTTLATSKVPWAVFHKHWRGLTAPLRIFFCAGLMCNPSHLALGGFCENCCDSDRGSTSASMDARRSPIVLGERDSLRGRLMLIV